MLPNSTSSSSEQRTCLWVTLPPSERTQRRERSGRAILSQLGPPVNHHRPQAGVFRRTQLWAVGAQKTAPRSRPSQPSCNATRRHLCGQTLVASTMRPSCMHQRKGSCSRTVHCDGLNVATTAQKSPFDGGPWLRMAGGIQPSHRACVSAITGVKHTRSSSFPAVMSTIV